MERYKLQLKLPPIHDKEAILTRLDRVLDPELDQSVLRLGFVEAIEAEEGHLTVQTYLPTYWCSPNFAYMMAEDIRRELLAVDTVEAVTIRLRDHAHADLVEAGVNSGKSFSEAFTDEADADLGELRGLFLRKGYTRRQEAILRRLTKSEFSFEHIAGLRLEDVSYNGEQYLIQHPEGLAMVAGPAREMVDYLERRAEINLDCAPTAPLMLDLRGQAVPAAQLEKYLVYARTVRLSLEASGSLCTALLAARRSMESPYQANKI